MLGRLVPVEKLERHQDRQGLRGRDDQRGLAPLLEDPWPTLFEDLEAEPRRDRRVRPSVGTKYRKPSTNTRPGKTGLCIDPWC